MTIAQQLVPTVAHVTAFIEEHEEGFSDGSMGSDFVMNKELVTAVVERMGGKEAFLVAHAELLAEIDGSKVSTEKSPFHYSDEDNLKFWDAESSNIMDNLERSAEKVGDESVGAMVRVWFDETEIDEDDIEAALDEPACDYDSSSEARKEVCSWLGYNAISAARLGFITYMEAVAAGDYQ